MLIRAAEINFGTTADVRIDGARVTAVGPDLTPLPGESVLDAAGGALLPGLHDHHIHLMSLARSLESLRCGPPEVATAADLERRLRERAALKVEAEDDWIRGIGYHESVAGELDRDWLDRAVPSRPVRIQHRSGRLWILNSRALERLTSAGPPPHPAQLERDVGRMTGRLYYADDWLQTRLGGPPPRLARVSALLASLGVTGATDTTWRNTLREYRHFSEAAAHHDLLQEVIMMGDASLDQAPDVGEVRRGPAKFHLRESSLPDFDTFRASLDRSHAAGRPVAVHCVTVTELVFAATAVATSGSRRGDRIEHASLAPPDVLPLLADQGLTVVTQPNFIRERGDAYVTDVPASDRPWLYRGRGFLEAGVALAAGTDAPFGDPNPWLAMQAAVDRRTLAGATLGAAESLSPEQALSLFSGDPIAPGGGLRRIEPGTHADLCLLDRPWSVAREALAAVRVTATLCRGRVVWRC
ncbi:MAG TPA: amidohydrolase family protein [Steroidobacteraceae bacterium]|nr:amidohydrolase family protein [Steroidobacteraceae bacterium]